MGGYQRFRINEFAGLNEDENPDVLQPNELSACENVWKHGRAIGTRPGLEREGDYASAITSGKAVHGIVDYRDSYDANKRIVSLCGGVVHVGEADPGDVIAQTGTTITDPGAGRANAGLNLWTFAQHKNNLYMAGGANGDTVCKWTGTGNVTKVTFQNSSAVDIDSKYIFEKWNFLFLAGMNGVTVDDNPTVVRYSAINDGDTWPVGNTFGGTSAIGGISAYGDEYATGLADYTDNRGDWLLFLTNRQIYPVSFTALPGAPFRVESGIANGCVSQHAFASLGIDSGDAVYLSQNGIHSLRQSQQHGSKAERFLSWKIRPTFASINFSRISQSVSAYWPEEGIVLFAVPTGSNTHNDTILCLDVKSVRGGELTAENAVWYVWKLINTEVNFLTTAKDGSTNVRYLYMGDTEGNVVRFNRNVFTDLGSAYPVSWTTSHNDFQNPGASKGVGDCWVGMQPGGDYIPSMRFIFDYGRHISSPRPLPFPSQSVKKWNQVQWNQFQWGSRTATFRKKVYGVGQGDTVAVSFSHTGSNEPFRITTLAMDIRGAGETSGIAGE
jgi:hypothetical protein